MLKRAKGAPGILEVAMGKGLAVHLRPLMPHWAHGKRGSIIKMAHLILGRRHSFGELDIRPATFLWQCSGTFDPENRVQFVPETERRVWKPPWLQRCGLLVNSFPWFTTQTYCICQYGSPDVDAGASRKGERGDYGSRMGQHHRPQRGCR